MGHHQIEIAHVGGLASLHVQHGELELVHAAEFGRRVYYGALAALIESLVEVKTAGNLARRLMVLTHPVVAGGGRDRLPAGHPGRRDPVLPDRQRSPRARLDGADVEQGFEEWGSVLGDEVMTAALIDRLLHHCHIVNIRGNS